MVELADGMTPRFSVLVLRHTLSHCPPPPGFCTIQALMVSKPSPGTASLAIALLEVTTNSEGAAVTWVDACRIANATFEGLSLPSVFPDTGAAAVHASSLVAPLHAHCRLCFLTPLRLRCWPTSCADSLFSWNALAVLA